MIDRKRIITRATFTSPTPKASKAPLEHNSRVYEKGSPRKRGTITELGAEVSGVTFQPGMMRYINNAFLVNLGKAD